jgi:hypothetical protein
MGELGDGKVQNHALVLDLYQTIKRRAGTPPPLYTHVCTYIYIYIYILYIYIYVYMRVYMCVCVRMYIHNIYIYIYTHITCTVTHLPGIGVVRMWIDYG